MTKTLSCSIEDIEKADMLTISGTIHEDKFNEQIILSVGQTKIAINSQELAQALKTVVEFQQNKKVLSV